MLWHPDLQSQNRAQKFFLPGNKIKEKTNFSKAKSRNLVLTHNPLFDSFQSIHGFISNTFINKSASRSRFPPLVVLKKIPRFKTNNPTFFCFSIYIYIYIYVYTKKARMTLRFRSFALSPNPPNPPIRAKYQHMNLGPGRGRKKKQKKKINGMTCKGEVTCVLIHIPNNGNEFLRVLEHLSWSNIFSESAYTATYSHQWRECYPDDEHFIGNHSKGRIAVDLYSKGLWTEREDWLTDWLAGGIRSKQNQQNKKPGNQNPE